MKTYADDKINLGNVKLDDGQVFYSMGLTKREYFAAMALQGICANSHIDVVNESTADKAAIDSVEAADALIEELNRE